MSGDVTGSIRILDAVGGTTLLTIPFGPAVAPGYELLDPAGLDQVQRRRDVVTSPYIRGEYEVGSVEGATRYALTIHCVGTSPANAKTLKNTLIGLVTARTWALGETVGTSLETYDCDAADWTARVETQWIINDRVQVDLSIPARKIG